MSCSKGNRLGEVSFSWRALFSPSSLFALRVWVLLTALYYAFQPLPADATTCTPSGWSTPTDCIPIRVGDWRFTSQEVPWGRSVPGTYKSFEDFTHALTEVFTSSGFCYVNVTAVYPTGPDWSFGIQYRQDYDVAADFGLSDGVNPGCYTYPAYFGTLALREQHSMRTSMQQLRIA